MNRFERALMRAPRVLYRFGLGGVLGHRFLLLVHTGRRSGLPRQTVLEVVEVDADGVPVVVSGFGEASDWYRNIIAEPVVRFTMGRTERCAVAVRLAPQEARRVFERYAVEHPKAARAIGRRLGVSISEDLDRAVESMPVVRLVLTE